MRRTIPFLTVFVLVAVAASGPGHAAGRAATIGPVEARQSVQVGELTLIDIRHPTEWRETGVAAEAVTITMHDPNGPGAFLG